MPEVFGSAVRRRLWLGRALVNGLRRLSLHYNRVSIKWCRIETSNRLWTLRRYGDVGFLRAGETQPVVHLRFCRRVRAWFNLWLSARRVALWRSGSRMVGGGAAALVACAGPLM